MMPEPQAPNGASAVPGAASLATAAYRRRVTPKQLEAEVFARATRAIRAVAEAAEPVRPLAHARAVADNRRLWDTVHALVIDPSNALPVPLRASIAGVALAVVRETGAAAPDLQFIAEMNDQFAAALWR